MREVAALISSVLASFGARVGMDYMGAPTSMLDS